MNLKMISLKMTMRKKINNRQDDFVRLQIFKEQYLDKKVHSGPQRCGSFSCHTRYIYFTGRDQNCYEKRRDFRGNRRKGSFSE